MSELIDLPAGVLERIISMLDKDTIKNLRLACKKLSLSTNQVLFRAISLYDTPRSCRYLQSILAQPHLREEVIKLNLNTVEDDYVRLTQLILSIEIMLQEYLFD
jgi:DNA mismatch repair ATPase MutS